MDRRSFIKRFGLVAMGMTMGGLATMTPTSEPMKQTVTIPDHVWEDLTHPICVWQVGESADSETVVALRDELANHPRARDIITNRPLRLERVRSKLGDAIAEAIQRELLGERA